MEKEGYSRTMGSHPVRVRGLKPFIISIQNLNSKVAPRAGAWIETKLIAEGKPEFKVAPRAGAWIETFCLSTSIKTLKSRTPCGCVD